MPGARDSSVPELYAPWQRWLPRGEHIASPDALIEGSWDSAPASEIRDALIALRRTDPDRARDLIAAKTAKLPAPRRFRIREALYENLGEADEPYVRTLLEDRSDSVRDLALKLLDRMPGTAEHKEIARQLTELFELGDDGTMGIRKELGPGTAFARFTDLLGQAIMSAFAEAVGVSQDGLVRALSVEELKDNGRWYAECLARSGSPSAVAAFAERLAEMPAQSYEALLRLSPRLEPDMRRKLIALATAAAEILRETSLSATVYCAGDDLGWLAPDHIHGSACARC
jgi:hypothetical protein